MQLISAFDLATATIEPHEFLTFLSGHLRHAFIYDAKTLQQRMNTLEIQKDFDARFRIHELFCFADTWKQALAALVDKQNTVLMDLRNFTARKPGCIHELNTLVSVVPLNCILLIIDQTTDLKFLSKVLQQAWQQFPKDKAAGFTGDSTDCQIQLTQPGCSFHGFALHLNKKYVPKRLAHREKLNNLVLMKWIFGLIIEFVIA